MDTKDWNTGYAAGYKAGLQRAVAVCRATRDAYNKQEGKPHTPIGDMAGHCGGLIHALIDQNLRVSVDGALPFRFRDPIVRVVIAVAMLGFCAGALSQPPSPTPLDYSSSEWWLVYITGALATITFFLALYTARLWSATSRLVKDAKDTAQRQLRAYVCTKTPTVDTVKSADGVDHFKVRPRWRNAGNTPTQRMLGCTGMGCFDGDPPANFTFPDNQGGPYPAFAGPRTTIFGHEVCVPLADVVKVERGEKRLYIWGWVDYDDVFANTSRHRTEFCWNIRIDKFVDGEFAFTPQFYRIHNGADDECTRKPSPYTPP